jgi:putative nucleotidyltransferase with HDIG domain
MKRILFVDDEPSVLDGLRRTLRAWRGEWETAFARSGHEALALMAEQPFDVIVSDMRMPGMDGAQLLDEVTRRFPSAVRIMLSGQADRESVVRCVGPTHQYLSKPCEAAQLKATIDRALSLRQWMNEPSIQRVIAQVTSLPSLPALYSELVAELQSPDCSLTRIGEIIARDVAMTAKIMQLVNSSYFSLRQPVTTPQQAATVLGTDLLRALVLSINVLSSGEQVRVPGFNINHLLDHSLAVGVAAKALARVAGEISIANDSFVAGVLHDIGKLVLAHNLPDRYATVLELVARERLPTWAAECEVFGSSHAEVGAYLLSLWGLPDALIEAVAFHHQPRRCSRQAISAATTVHLANCWRHEQEEKATEPMSPVDEVHLAAIGCNEKLAAWREALHAGSRQ